MLHRKRIAVVTSSRADYGHLYWPLREMDARPGLKVELVAIGPHLSPEFGETVHAIEEDGFRVDHRIECLLSSDSDVGMAKTIGIATQSLADLLGAIRPDLVLVIADRYEMLAPASVALALRIPIVHIEGGEASEGAIDHAVRNALTMMSHVHLASTDLARRRIIAMGEEPWRVHQTGAPSLDHLVRGELYGLEETSKRLAIEFSPSRVTAVVGYHPVTLKRNPTIDADAFFEALKQMHEVIESQTGRGTQIVFCFPNADAGSRGLTERARTFCEPRANAYLKVNLDPRLYWSLLRQSDLLIGNSSSGIMESPTLKIPAVNVGSRQKGRERAANVIDVEADTDSILAGITRAFDPAFQDSLASVINPFGDGGAGQRIADILDRLEITESLLHKPALEMGSRPQRCR